MPKVIGRVVTQLLRGSPPGASTFRHKNNVQGQLRNTVI